ncbi:hypothetical protein [Sphingomonas sp. DT-204]|uniref:hypothetical protein n=1 Tax=Sphingomonas sp. DT-204 TaxID=3396166 RepID=UPI003F1A31F7
MVLAVLSLSLVLPTIAHAAAPHSGQVVRSGFALSDVALFVFAAIGVWLAQRSMRRRAGKRAKD